MSIVKDSVTNVPKLLKFGKRISMAKKRLSTEESTTPENIHILIEIQISEKMKTDLTPGIQNPRKIQDIFFQTIAHITTDIKIMKQIADVEMTPI